MVTLYHNPRCGKSRECLLHLQQTGEEVHLIHYLQTPPTFAELSNIITMLGIKPIELVRRKEAVWMTEFKNKTLTDTETIEAMVAHPILIERPIAMKGNRAVIARPPEKVLSIL